MLFILETDIIFPLIYSPVDLSNLKTIIEIKNSMMMKNETTKKEDHISEITNAKDFAEGSIMFSLYEEIKVLIFAIGEGAGNDMYDFGWVENIATADTLWKMSIEATTDAGGAMKNRLINTSILLPAGKYQLRFKSGKSFQKDCCMSSILRSSSKPFLVNR